ncbi:Holliday junction resolvase RuvX [Candidatus Peregrinibacteria bacterium]|nr:Holliday junction resolvase RuvX [Candidatus Peregrinibacteria bacterium]
MKEEKVLALDYGRKRVGVATGDTEFGIAFPRGVILNKGISDLVDKLENLCKEIDAKLIVIGFPLNMREEQIENEIIPDVKNLKNKLENRLDEVKVILYDERLSSFEADKLMEEAMKSYGKKQLGRDAYAAQIILQRFFDKI